MLLFLLIAATYHEPVVQDRCDSVEVSHVYDHQGQRVLSQLIFRSWRNNRVEIVNWRLLKRLSERPQKYGGGYMVRLTDDTGYHRIRCSGWTETWEQYDAEVLEREWLPKCERRKLRR